MDIRNLIKRLQDIDKIKIILFDEKRLQEFENLPKPLAKQTNQNKENLINFRTQISEAIEKSLYLKSVRNIMNNYTKGTSLSKKIKMIELIKNQNFEKNRSIRSLERR